jgi:hypothetical protein
VQGNGTPPHYGGPREVWPGKPVRASSLEPVMRSLTLPPAAGRWTANQALVEVLGPAGRTSKQSSDRPCRRAVRASITSPWMRSQLLNASQKASKSSCNS